MLTGLPSESKAYVEAVAKQVAHTPRFLYLHWPFGHALGEPGNVGQQRTVLNDMLSMTARAPQSAFVLDLPYRRRRETYSAVIDWNTPSEALTTALSAAPNTSSTPATLSASPPRSLSSS